jgi:COMPASS component SWD2
MSSTLTEEKVSRFREAVTFSGESDITSIDFSVDGKFLVAANDSEQIVWFDCLRGKEKQVIHSHKYGVKIVKYTNGKTAVLHSSSKLNHDIRLLDVEKQNYYRYFKGQKGFVTSLAISAEEDIFISGAKDRTVLVYDFRQEKPAGKLLVNAEKPSVAFDPSSANRFAVGFENNSNILLYDLRSYKENHILKKISLERDRIHSPNELKISKDGMKILTTTTGSFIHLHEISSGLPLALLTGMLCQNVSYIEY